MSKPKLTDKYRSKLKPNERKIYDSLLANFPATDIETAHFHAINGGVKFQYYARH